MRSLIIIISIVVFYAGMGYSQDLPVAWLGFDELADEITIEKISKSECTIHGNFKIVDGVVGKALRSDGFTTSINCGSDRAQWIYTDF